MSKSQKTIIACGGMKAEFERLNPADNGIEMHYMPQNLHRVPDTLRKKLQETIDRVAEDTETIILGYGLCCNGVVGLKAPEQGLIVPKVHDCIALYMGSTEKYRNMFSQNPGTYHLTRNWMDNKKDPLGLVEHEYKRRLGAEDARETMEWEIKNYSHISYINTGTGRTEQYRNRALENARQFNKQFMEISGDDAFFRKIVHGPWDKKNFVHIKPHEISKQEYFLK
ncbi:MAG: DUF1638 domain-containing protein [Bacteroidales bacterium]|nr:DUF1638 domain-containing protein [Bacteroidales bacterium]